MKILSKLLMFFLLLFCIILNSNAQDNAEILQVAERDIYKTLQNIPEGREKLYGFNNREEFEITEFGQVLRMYIYDNEEITATNTWRIPVMVKNEYRALASISYINQTLQIVDFGANVLAEDIQNLINQNTDKQFNSFLRVYELQADFLINPDNRTEFFALTSAQKIFKNKNTSQIYTIEEIINKINTNF